MLSVVYMHACIYPSLMLYCCLKYSLRANDPYIQGCEDSEMEDILAGLASITAKDSIGWMHHSGHLEVNTKHTLIVIQKKLPQ